MNHISSNLLNEIQKGNNPIIKNYQDIVVHSDKLDKSDINNLVCEFSKTICMFEEIFYLIDKLNTTTLEKICMENLHLLNKNTDLTILFNKISEEVCELLYKTQNQIV